MLNFFRKNQDPKKVQVTEKEVDGFVILGNTVTKERKGSKDDMSMYTARPTCEQTSQVNSSKTTEAGAEMGTKKNQNVESSSSMVELLSDVPFTLAPHVLAVQETCHDLPRQLLSYDVNDNLTRFCNTPDSDVPWF